MTVSAHIDTLRRKHLALSAEVEAAQRAPATDTLEIRRLKKEKLRLKEEMTRLAS